MAMRPDHMILTANDAAASVAFYTRVLGFTDDGPRPPFTQVRASPDFVILLAEWPTKGGEHLAFAVEPGELEQILARVRDAGIPYGDAFDNVGSQRGPGTADGAHGVTQSLYVNDPSGHLIEIVCYPEARA
jgi:catechol 2,3-dioxygenase-like lactoylglutathione lyase family enzyme